MILRETWLVKLRIMVSYCNSCGQTIIRCGGSHSGEAGDGGMPLVRTRFGWTLLAGFCSLVAFSGHRLLFGASFFSYHLASRNNMLYGNDIDGENIVLDFGHTSDSGHPRTMMDCQTDYIITLSHSISLSSLCLSVLISGIYLSPPLLIVVPSQSKIFFNNTDKWQQAYRFLGAYIDCSNSKEGGGHSHDNNNNEQDSGHCSRWMIWAAVSDALIAVVFY